MQSNSKNIDFDTIEHIYLNVFQISIELNEIKSCRFGKTVTNRFVARKCDLIQNILFAPTQI